MGLGGSWKLRRGEEGERETEHLNGRGTNVGISEGLGKGFGKKGVGLQKKSFGVWGRMEEMGNGWQKREWRQNLPGSEIEGRKERHRRFNT
jgi:hypothetical protein